MTPGMFDEAWWTAGCSAIVIGALLVGVGVGIEFTIWGVL